MTPDDYFELGYIVKPHGLKGALQAYLDVDDPSKYNKMESVFVQMGENLVPFFINSIQISGNKAFLEFDDIKTVNEALPLKSCALYLPVSQLPKLKAGQFYYHEVVGYVVVDEAKGKLGVVESILAASAQDIVSMNYQGKEILFPISDAIVLDANHEKKELYVRLPNGLLEIYLQ